MSTVTNNPSAQTTGARQIVRPAATTTVAGTKTPAPQDNLDLSNRAVAPTGIKAAATGSTAPNFKNGDEYKTWVTARVKALVDALAAQSQDQADLQSASTAKAAADVNFGKNMRAIQAELQSTTAQYQAPIDSISSDLNGANSALQTIKFPGHQHALELNAQANQVQGQIDSASSQVDSFQANNNRLAYEEQQARQQIANANQARAQIEPEMAQLQYQAPSQYQLGAQSGLVNETTNELRTAQAQLDAANQRLEQAIAAAAPAAGGATNPYAAVPPVDPAKKPVAAAGVTPPAVTATRPAPPAAAPAAKTTPAQLAAATAPASTAKNPYAPKPAVPPATPAAVVTPAAAPAAASVPVATPAAPTARPTPPAAAPATPAANPYGAAPATRPAPPVVTAPATTATNPYTPAVPAPSTQNTAAVQEARAQVEAANRTLTAARNRFDSATQQMAAMQDISTRLENDRESDNSAIAAVNAGAATIATDDAQIAQGNQSIGQLGQSIQDLTGQRNQLQQASAQEDSRTTPNDDPKMAAALQRVSQLTSNLQQARDTYAVKVADPQSRLDAARAQYASDMAAPTQAASQDQAKVNADDQSVSQLKSEVGKLKDLIGLGTRLSWKWHGFDFDKYWKTDGAAELAKVGMKP